MSEEPMKYLAEYNRLLKLGGTLYIQTPNIKSLLSSLFKNYWYGLNAPRNKYFFSRKALKNALLKNGFIDVKVTTNIARTHEYAWHSFNIVRNNWTSLNFIVPFSWFMCFLKGCLGVVGFISGNGGEDLIGVARKPN
jgi:predicted SAM-dependent methyltransferase